MLTHQMLVHKQVLLKGNERFVNMLASPLAMSVKLICLINHHQENVGVRINGGHVSKNFLYIEVGLLRSMGSGGLCPTRPLLLVCSVSQTLHVTLPGLSVLAVVLNLMGIGVAGSQMGQEHPPLFLPRSQCSAVFSGQGVKIFNFLHIGSGSF